MGKSSAAPLDYAALMRDIRAQGLKHALEKQPARNGGMVAKTLPVTYGQMHEGKGLKKVVTSRTVSAEAHCMLGIRQCPLDLSKVLRLG